MNKNLKIRLLADSGMTLALLLLMSYQLVGEKAHEWIGMAMFLLVIGHHVLNRRWMGNITRGKYTVHPLQSWYSLNVSWIVWYFHSH